MNKLKLILLLSLCWLSACQAGSIGTSGGGSVGSGGLSNGAAPETPPQTVEMTPGCGEGVKPTEACPGSKLPAKPEACPLSVPVVIDEARGIWWCECPADTRTVYLSQEWEDTRCLCPSGKSLSVNESTGRSLGCGFGDPDKEEIVFAANKCPGDLVWLNKNNSKPANRGIVKDIKQSLKQCGCPEGSVLYQQSCVCPSGQTIPVNVEDSAAVKSCDQLTAPCAEGLVLLLGVHTPGVPNYCGCPQGTESIEDPVTLKVSCMCPSGLPAIINSKNSSFVRCPALNEN